MMVGKLLSFWVLGFRLEPGVEKTEKKKAPTLPCRVAG